MTHEAIVGTYSEISRECLFLGRGRYLGWFKGMMDAESLTLIGWLNDLAVAPVFTCPFR